MAGKKGLLAAAGGVAVGLLNGLLGAGGGMVTVPLLDRLGVRGQKSHATSLAVIVPLSFVSAWLYWRRGWFSPGELLPFLPGGLLVWVETKRPVGGRTSPAQRVAHLMLRRLGQRVELVATKEEADRLLAELTGRHEKTGDL